MSNYVWHKIMDVWNVPTLIYLAMVQLFRIVSRPRHGCSSLIYLAMVQSPAVSSCRLIVVVP